MTADTRFRRQVAQSLDEWIANGLIAEDQRDRFRQYYQLDRLAREANSRFTTVLLTIGALLIGLGAISFVAANWDRLLPSVRAIGVLALMVCFDTTGYWLLRGSGQSKNYRRLGSALLLVGQLMLGASLGLMAQWFQVGGSPAGLYFWWGLGVFGVAVTARHNLSGVLAMVLFQLTWSEEPTALAPLMVLATGLPLAYWCRSRWVFAAVVLATNVSAVWAVFNNVGLHSATETYLFWLVYIGLTSMWWAYGTVHQRMVPDIVQWLPECSLDRETDSDPNPLEANQSQSLEFAPFARILSMFGLLGAFSILSIGQLYMWSEGWLRPNWGELVGKAPILTGTIWGLVGLSSVLWVWMIRDRQSRATRTTVTRTTATRTTITRTTITLDAAVGMVSVATVLLINLGIPWSYTSWIFNLLLFGLACTLIWAGLQMGTRWYYWAGLLAVTLQILSRFFEYDTGLLLKSIVLIVCGIGTIAAGMSFERRLQQPSRLER
ncbi:MAG: DUF2157 domain-containing protein [Synechococcus sp.]